MPKSVSLVLLLFVCFGQVAAQEIAVPTVTDPNLELSLVASEPQIVTPVGLAADLDGRLYVVESHTHARGSSYDGPAHDRIWVYEDSDGDGSLDRHHVFADGLRQALAIALSQDGSLYVVQMKSVIVVRDTDRDGSSDSTETVLRIETENNNNHGVFLGLALDHGDQLYVSLGNIGGKAYRITGADGDAIEGQGDTGLIVRCGVDGSGVQRFAEGFWNPCDLKFDVAGRLLATDNDPDARGPNRVLHVIFGGDYGYKSRYGSSGLHPYCSWNGELPGTLPMIAGVGEAPVGLLDCNAASLPEQYADDLLVCVWGTGEVVRVRTETEGVSLTGRAEPLLVGGPDFRPTSITASADGTIYIADWADRRYPVHGKGRLWRLAPKPGVKTIGPKREFSGENAHSGESTLSMIRAAADLDAYDALAAATASDDPFVISTAVDALSQPVFRPRLLSSLEESQSSSRFASLLALQASGIRLSRERFSRLLRDDDPVIRKLTMIWIGETERRDLAGDLMSSLPLQTSTADLFDTFLATLHRLRDGKGGKRTSEKPGSRIDEFVDQEMILNVLEDDQLPLESRAMAVRYLSNGALGRATPILLSLARSGDPVLAAEAIRRLAAAGDATVTETLVALASDLDEEIPTRCEAIMALAASDGRDANHIVPWVTDPVADVALTAARALTSHVQKDSVRQAIKEKLESLTADELRESSARQLRFAINPAAVKRPRTDLEWTASTQRGGDATAGRRVFFDGRVGCAKCHRVRGSGGSLGPDLSNVSAAKTRRQVLASILHPSQDKSPDYQGYLVVMEDGRVFKGTQFHYRGESAEMLLEDGKRIRFRLDQTEEFRPLETSLMPEDLVESMSPDELRDLLAYLDSLR